MQQYFSCKGGTTATSEFPSAGPTAATTNGRPINNRKIRENVCVNHKSQRFSFSSAAQARCSRGGKVRQPPRLFTCAECRATFQSQGTYAAPSRSYRRQLWQEYRTLLQYPFHIHCNNINFFLLILVPFFKFVRNFCLCILIAEQHQRHTPNRQQ